MKYLFSLLVLTLLLNCSTNRGPAEYATIQYEAGACFGFCPIFKMTINKDRTTVFEAERFNFSRDTQSQESEGTFKGKIDQQKYDELTALLNALQLKNLKEDYGNKNVTDLPTSYLTISYQDGSFKKIQDYGKHGTPELVKLYQFFEELKTNQTWTKIK
ncbi:DUF6438 domain-containing protein [Chryseobacterium sp. MDT2-18]|uniref:DUF6438 domain-containing protein n=1 Tax=Chryseobacterium sp. MDT2-18 TaxID=1259136 RepID=UPI002781A447|nr:DUF6438 domain-containing protein [Chryseobacterium sp. MDT2-18]MDQ0476422.1 hypothetical protein [Chryseobacterium sp. MDT2-18]